MNMGIQEIDIFSRDGKYIYHAVIELHNGLQIVNPIEFTGKNLYALVKNETGEHKLVKYDIMLPEYSNAGNEIKDKILEERY